MFSNSSPEQLANAGKTFFETQFSLLNELGSKTLTSAGQLAALNVAAVRACAEESLAQVQQLRSAADPQGLLSQSAAQASAGAEKAASYGRHVAGIASDLHSQFLKAAQEQLTQTQTGVTALVEAAARTAPVGGDHVVSFVKSAIDTGNAGAEQIARSAREGVKAIEEQVARVSGQFFDALKSGTAR